MQHEEFFTVWHSPKEPSNTFAPASEIVKVLERDYGFVCRISETSEIPNHVAIQVPAAHVSRAALACEDHFGRFSPWKPKPKYGPSPQPTFNFDIDAMPEAVV